MSLSLRRAAAAPLVSAPVGKRLPLTGMLPTPLALETERMLAGGQGGGSPAPALMRPGGQILTRRAAAAPIVRSTATPVVTTAQAAPLQPFTPPPPIVAAPIRPVNGILTKVQPHMSLAIRSAQQQTTGGPGIIGGIVQGARAVGAAAVGAVTNWAVGQIGGSRSASGSPPSIPMPSMPGPGGAQMGMGASIGRAAGAVGTVVGRIAGSKKVRGVVGGILGWWLIDKATGAILGQTSPPSRRMNVLNLRALRRADRRVDGFVKVARRALSSTGFKVERRGKSCAPKRKRCK